MTTLIKVFYWFCVLSLGMVTHAEPLKVTISGAPTTNINDTYFYYTQMLNLALEKTRITDGDFIVVYLDHRGGIERDRAMLIANAGIDVMWGSVTKERAEKLRVVDVDLLKGLNNYRALLIHKNSQPRFDNVKTLQDMKIFSAGSGHYWTDGTIMHSNGFKVIYGANYSGLFKMLSAGRFDFLSRGLHEVSSDIATFGDLGLVQEKNILLQYDNPVRYCFYVNKDNKKLAERIERGLKIAKEDGSFDELFMKMPMLKAGHYILQNNQRKVFKIHNDVEH